MLGPALGAGGLFNLDLVVPDRLDLPNGFWGLGPELPRRLPLWVPISAVSPVVPAPLVVKALMVAGFAVAWAGMARLVRPVGSAWWSATAGALYAFSPFLLTRASVGHFMITVPAAALPWVLPTLLRPGRRLGVTFLAAATLGVGGHFGGSLAMLIAVVGVLVVERERWLRGLAVTVAAQAAWLVPGIAVAAFAAVPIGDAPFPTAARGLGGALRLSAGGGFWNTPLQVGGSGVLEAALGAVVLGLAIAGTKHLPSGLRRPLVVLGVAGWLLAWAQSSEWSGRLFDALTGNPIGAVWRESHRLLLLHLLWLAPAAALGARRVARRLAAGGRGEASGAAAALPMAIAVTLAMPGLWGYGGHLVATPIPASWMQARTSIDAEGGTVLSLPWHLYFNLRVGDDSVRRVLNPLPLVLGGDVLASSDTGLSASSRERADPREPHAERLVRRLERGEPIAEGLVGLGVRWVAVIPNELAGDYANLPHDPGLRIVIRSEDLALYEVVGWRGSAVTRQDVPLQASGVTWDPGTSDAVIWYRPGGGGWRRGWESVHTSPDGVLEVPPGRGRIWNLGTPLALGAQFGWTIAVAIVALRWRRRTDVSTEAC